MDTANKSDLAKAPKNTREGTQHDRKGRTGRMTSHHKTKLVQKLKMDWVWSVFSAPDIIKRLRMWCEMTFNFHNVHATIQLFFFLTTSLWTKTSHTRRNDCVIRQQTSKSGNYNRNSWNNFAWNAWEWCTKHSEKRNSEVKINKLQSDNQRFVTGWMDDGDGFGRWSLLCWYLDMVTSWDFLWHIQWPVW